MIVLEANYSKKLGLPQYSSHQYSVSVKTELTDINQVQEESRRLYELLQQSVDQQIQNNGYLPGGESPPTSTNARADRPADSRASAPARNGEGDWRCSPKQKALILKVVEENHLDKRVIEELAHERFGKGVRQINKLEASGLIDELFERYASNHNGNGHRKPFRRQEVTHDRSN